MEILLMVDYGDRLRCHKQVCVLFNEIHFERSPVARSTVSRIVAKFNQTRNVRDVPRCGKPKINDNTKLNVSLSLEDNPHITTTEMAL